MSKRITTALYVRVSTGKQELKNQVLQLEEYCKKKNYEVLWVYKDIMTGKSSSRPGFQSLFSAARRREFDLVLFWDISRFSRAGTLYTLQKLKELQNLGIEWESFREPYFKSMGQFGDVVISIMATLSKIEREKISERTIAGLQRAKKYGKVLGRPAGSTDKTKRFRSCYALPSKKGASEL